MAIIGTFTNPLKNGTTEDATQVMNLFSFIQSQVNSNACPSTTGQAILKGDGSGGTTAAVDGTDYTIPGPVFSCYQSTIQAVANNTSTKVLLQTNEFDSAGALSANGRFQPPVAGYYQISGSVQFSNSSALMLASVYKNGAEYKRGAQYGSAASSGVSATVSALVYLNGTSDYVELWANQQSGGSLNTTNLSTVTYFQGVKVR